MIDWGRGYAASWHVRKVNPDTWADAEEVGAVSEIRIERKADGDLQAGGFELDGTAFAEGYYRLFMLATQGGETQRVDAATLLCGRSETREGARAVSIDGRSVLHPASVTRLAKGTYAPMGANGAEYAAGLLAGAVAAPVTMRGGFELSQSLVFDAGTTVLDAAWMVLAAGGHTIRVDGYGRVEVAPLPTTPALEIGEGEARMVQPTASRSLDWSGVPNRVTVIDGDAFAQATNEDPHSPTSVTSRGYWNDAVETNPVRVNGEGLQAYAERRLRELSVVADERSYAREWAEGVYPNDIVRLSVASAGLEGDMRITEQSYECGKGIVVTEKARMEVSTWA